MRRINYKHLGWMVSTILYWCFVAPFSAWYVISTLKNGTAPDAAGLFVAAMIAVWYNWRNQNVGYGLSYWRNWNAEYENSKWQANMRAKRERARIEHHRRNGFDYDVIAK